MVRCIGATPQRPYETGARINAFLLSDRAGLVCFVSLIKAGAKLRLCSRECGIAVLPGTPMQLWPSQSRYRQSEGRASSKCLLGSVSDQTTGEIIGRGRHFSPGEKVDRTLCKTEAERAAVLSAEVDKTRQVKVPKECRVGKE